jgi:hypothetical protein
MLRCSFCRRSDAEVAKLVAGPRRLAGGRVFICDRCADESVRIMGAPSGEPPPAARTRSLLRRLLNRIPAVKARARGVECHAAST